MTDTHYVRRGLFLGIILGLTITGAFIGAIVMVSMAGRFAKIPVYPPWFPYAMAISGLLLSFSALAAWNWKKAGLYGMIITTAAICIIAYLQNSDIRSFSGLVLPLAAVMAATGKWKYFK